MNASKDRQALWGIALCGLLLLLRLRLALYPDVAGFAHDEAVAGIMAQHIGRGENWPIFMYGQAYLFPLSSYLAAPLTALAGPSVFAVRLPLVLINLFLFAWLAAWVLRTPARTPWAWLSLIFFCAPSLAAGYDFVHLAEGCPEAMAFIIAAWLLRKRPLALGALSAVANLNRPYILYGLASLAFLETRWDRSWKWQPRHSWRYWARWSATAAGIQIVSKLAHGAAERWSSDYGGLKFGAYPKPPRFMFEDFRGFVAETLPRTLGFGPQDSWVARGFPWLDLAYRWTCGAMLLYLAYRLVAWWIGLSLTQRRAWISQPRDPFALYLATVGGVTLMGYVLFSPPLADLAVLRYTHLILLALVGGWILALREARRPLTQALLIGFIVAIGLRNTLGQLSAWHASHIERPAPVERLISHLKERGLTYGWAEYTLAYQVTFLSDGKVIVSPDNYRIRAHARAVRAAPAQNRFRLTAEPCASGEKVLHWWVCPG